MRATPVTDNVAEQQFETVVDSTPARLVYRRDGRRLVLIHTEVPDALAGQGVGGRLVTAAVDVAAEQDLTLVPECPFARGWLERHPEVAGRIRIDWPEP